MTRELRSLEPLDPEAVHCEHEPAHADKLCRAGDAAAEATTDLNEGIAEIRKRLEADGNLAVTQPTGKRTVRIPFVGLAGSASARSRRPRSRPRRPETDDAPAASTTTEPAVGLLVSTQCRHLIREFLGYQEDEVRTAVAQDHALDALCYVCMGVVGEYSRSRLGPRASAVQVPTQR